MKTLKAWQDKAISFIERLDKWWNKTAKPQLVQIDKVPDYLEGRVVYCVNCFDEAEHRSRLGPQADLSKGKTTLWRYQGRVVCSSCNSDSWYHPVGFSILLNK